MSVRAAMFHIYPETDFSQASMALGAILSGHCQYTENELIKQTIAGRSQ